jgi:uncharacterized protein YdaL
MVRLLSRSPWREASSTLVVLAVMPLLVVPGLAGSGGRRAGGGWTPSAVQQASATRLGSLPSSIPNLTAPPAEILSNRAPAKGASPRSLAPPTTSGRPATGRTLTASDGVWSNVSSFAYRWLRCDRAGRGCTAIAGATTWRYTVRPGDAGHALRAEVTARNASGAATARSGPVVVGSRTIAAAGAHRLQADVAATSASGSTTARTAAAAAGTTLILYDTTGATGWIGQLYATMTANLVGHFGSYEAKPVASYAAGDIGAHALTIYLGSTYDEPLPGAFLDDVYSASKPVVWVYDNIWQLTSRFAATWQATYGWSWSQFDTSRVAEVDYKNVALTRDADNAGGIMAYSYVDPSKATTVAEAVHSDGSRFPWALRSRNLTYIGESPLSFIGETDRYYIFADLLYDALAPNTAEHHSALLRIEDIDPTSDPSQLEAIADYLSSNGIPFGFAVISRYRDPLNAESGPNDVLLRNAPQVIAAIKYLQAHGGVLVEHGYTHQYDSTANPYNGLTGDDVEFYRVVETPSHDLSFVGPVPEDSESWALSRIDAANAELAASGIGAPKIFEFPHYEASAADYAAAAQRFTTRWERSLYFEGTLTGAAPSYDHYAGQFFPYPVRDVYGSLVLPENVGDYEPVPFHQFPAHSVAQILAAARAATVVRDGFAGVYYHANRGLAPLQQIVTGLQQLGYTFVDPASLGTGVEPTPPAAPSVPDLAAASDSGVSDSDNVTNKTTLTFTGTAQNGSTVTLYRGTTAVGTTTADAVSGTWSITDAVAADGAYGYTATATDRAGNTSGASDPPLPVTVDTVAPALNVSGAVSGSSYTLPQLPTRPTFDPADGGSGIAVGSPADSWTTPGTSSGAGTYVYTAGAADKAGNQARESRTYTVVAPAPTPSGGGGGSSGGGGGAPAGTTSAAATTTTTVATSTTPVVTPTPAPAKATQGVEVKPVIGKPVTVPAKLVAGKTATISYKVTRSNTGALLTGGTMTCSPTIKGKLIAHREQLKRGTATVRLTIPKTARGKQLKVQLTVKLNGQAGSRTSTFRIT